MNRTKRLLLSMVIVSTIFCITSLFNIQLPFFTVKGSGAAAANSKDAAVIHTFSFNADQAKTFNVDQYLSSGEAQMPEADNTAIQAGLAAENAETLASPQDAAPTGEASVLFAAAADQAQAPGADDAANQDAGTEIASAAEETAAVSQDTEVADTQEASKTNETKQQPEVKEAKYSDIGISIAKEFVNIRKEPSTSGKILGKLYRNSACRIISEKDGWYYVESGSVTGYVNADYIKTGLSDDELIEKYASLKICVAVDGLNVRKDASTESKKLTCVYKNEKYTVLEKDGDWVKIHLEDENIDGYVMSQYTADVVVFEDAVSKEEEDKILQVKAEERAKAETEVKYGDGFTYTDEDLILLACLIHAEAGDQSYEGKLAVANIVLNRVKSSKYPDTIKGVIYQPGQFSVAKSGSLQKQLDNYKNYNSKSQKLSIKAAKEALEGANNIGNRLYFHTYEAAAKDGHNDLKSSVKIQDHLFW